MAFVSQSSPDQAQDPNQQGQSPLSQQAPMTSAPNAGAGKSAVTPSNSAPTQPFTNLQNYLSANQPQIQQMGNDISGKLTSQYGQIKSDIDQGQQTFAGQVDAGYTPNDPNVISAFTASPSAVANDPSKAAAFKGMLNDTYTGPANVETSPIYGQLSGEVQNGVSTADQINSNGLSSYLTSANPNYTQGMATLDAALLQGNPDVQAQINAAATPFHQLPGYLTSAVTSGDQAVQNAVQQAQTAKAAATGAFTTAGNNFTNDLNSRFQAAVKQAQGFNADFNDILARLNGTMPVGSNGGIQALTPAEQAELGVSQGTLDQLAQANRILSMYQQSAQPIQALLAGQPTPSPMLLSSYLTGGNTAALPTMAGFASPDDYKTAAALSSLGGGTFNSPLDPAQVAQAGTYKMTGNAPTFDMIKANGLFDQVKGLDTALANNFFSQNPSISSGDYQAAVEALSANPSALTPDAGATYELSALDRLANGFGSAPALPTPPAPGTNGDLGAGFHIDPTTNQWVPTIPNAPTTTPPDTTGYHTPGI